MFRHVAPVALILLASAAGEAADLKKVDRQLKKEPAYQTKSPRYVLLAFGPEAKDRVWLVRDGDVLYVDRNGDGDLTAPGNKVAAKKDGPRDEGPTFEAGELTLNGKKHTHLKVAFYTLKGWMFGETAKRADLLAALKADPDAEVMSMSIDAEAPHLRTKGRISQYAGPIDHGGALLPSKKPADAPVVHLGGPMQVTFSSRPTLRRGKSCEFTLVVGTPGLGGGTFAMLAYDETIPADAHPVADVTFPAEKQGGEPVKKRFEFKERC